MKTIFANRRLVAGAAIFLAAVLFVAVNVISDRLLPRASVDLTDEGLFTLSDGTRTILGEIEEPIILRLFFSADLGDAAPQFRTYAVRVRELLDRYAQISGGMVRLQFLDPETFSEEEDQAVAFGLQGVPINQAGDAVYFGLAGTNTTGDTEVIVFLQPERERFLEYDLTRLVQTLANPRKAVVGLVRSTIPIDGQNPMQPQAAGEPWVIFERISERFDLRDLGFQPTDIPDDIDVLVLLHPKNVSDAVRYAVDQFVLRGGRVLVFLDPHSEADPAGAGAGARFGGARSDLPKLLGAWGVAYDPNKVAGDIRLARRVNVGEGRLQVLDYPAWLILQGEYINRADVATADVANLNIQTAGVLSQAEGATTEFVPLVLTSDAAMAMDADLVREVLPDFETMLRDYKPGGAPLVLAARIRGRVKSVFPDGPPTAPKDKKAKDEGDDAAKPARAHLTESAEPANIVIVADTDLLNDRSWIQRQEFFGKRVALPIAGNGGLVINLIDNLAGSNALIGLRGRGQSRRPFTKVEELEFEADQRYRAQEQALQTRLSEVRKQLSDLQTRREAGGEVILSASQREAIDGFQADLLATRRQLREVQHALRQDIEALEGWLEFV
ncbi:MAG: GldG family protein, partial [Alphaproteobacteria bacterium]